jgi:hypothetical protein
VAFLSPFAYLLAPVSYPVDLTSSELLVRSEELCQSLINILKLLGILLILQIGPSSRPPMMSNPSAFIRPLKQDSLHSIVMMVSILIAPLLLIHLPLDAPNDFLGFIDTWEETEWDLKVGTIFRGDHSWVDYRSCVEWFGISQAD